MYKLGKPVVEGNPAQIVQRLSDGTWIPFDEQNRDYQEYLKWVAEGNTPQPAEE